MDENVTVRILTKFWILKLSGKSLETLSIILNFNMSRSSNKPKISNLRQVGERYTTIIIRVYDIILNYNYTPILYKGTLINLCPIS